MSIKDYAIGKVNKWLGSQGYTVAKKTPIKRTVTRTATKTTTKKKTTRTVARKPATRKTTPRSTSKAPSLSYAHMSNPRATEFDKLVGKAQNAYAYVWAARKRGLPKDVYKSCVNDYAKNVVNLSNYLKRHGCTMTPEKLDSFVDNTISRGVKIKSTLKECMKPAKTRLKTAKSKSVSNSRLASMARFY